MGIDVSVIIVNYHTSVLIADCVKSIIEKTEGITYEVIIIDNNSEPDLETYISEFIPNPLKNKFIFIRLPENVGFGRANNEGIKIAKGRNILFLNPDTLLVNNAFKILVDFMDSTPDAGACGANILDENQNPSEGFWRIFPGIKNEFNALFSYKPAKIIFGKNLTYNHTDKPLKVAFIIGADLMVKKSVVDKLNGFRPEFFMFSEETDLCLRIKRSGKNIYCVPQAKIIHLEGKSFGDKKFESETRIKYMEESRRIYLKLNHNKITGIVATALNRLNLYVRMFIQSDKEKKAFYKRKIEIVESL